MGLGADGISSSCYGPQEAFLALQGHYYLAIILAVMTAVTVFIISASYMQIIKEFPSGGGAYLVASKLLSPTLGMITGCALIVDYVLTIAVSIASGMDAVFSMLPVEWAQYKIIAAACILGVLIILNLRGVKESVMPVVPFFLIFLLTHGIALAWAVIANLGNIPSVMHATVVDFHDATNQLGIFGVFALLMHAYSLGGGTYTGIEAVSNSMPMLREPRVETARKTMIYMAFSLAIVASGLILAYLMFNLSPVAGKTLNAILFERVAASWGVYGSAFILLALASEALILLVAAQTGFLGGPRVLVSMATDKWMPKRFALLNDRLVTQNGILLMGGSALAILFLAKGSVGFLVVLYSINVFLAFSLSQLGMCRHWWRERAVTPGWKQRLAINGVGFMLTSFILLTVVVSKFNEGGWLTIVVTTSLVAVCVVIKRHYDQVEHQLKRLDTLLSASLPAETAGGEEIHDPKPSEDVTKEMTAIIIVSGFNGLGLHALFNVVRIFKGLFKNFVFIQIGIVDAGRFKGTQEIGNLEKSVHEDLKRYVNLVRRQGYHAEYRYAIDTNVVDGVTQLATEVAKKYPMSVLFAGQLVFPKETIFSGILHNYTSFAIQNQLYYQGIPVLVLPVRVEDTQKA